MGWKTIDLHGAADISRVVAVYEVGDLRVPWSRYKIKVLERTKGDFLASPNVCVKVGGVPDWIGGLGNSELEALQDAVFRISEILSGRQDWGEHDFEWADPNDF